MANWIVHACRESALQGSSMAIVQTTVGADGKINYDALLKQGGGKDKVGALNC